MRLKSIVTLLYLFSACSGFAQLVTKRDYDAAFAIQAGANTGITLPGSINGLKIDGIYGLKMTFPFTRVWFLGAELNYNRLRTQNKQQLTTGQEKSKVAVKTEALNIPIYLKYRLSSNTNSLLIGGYFSWIFKGNLYVEEPADTRRLFFSNPAAEALAAHTDNWDAGVTIGFEQSIVKHLNFMFRISGSVKDLLKQEDNYPKKLFPLQANLTLSFDILRIGDCGCD